MNKLKKLVMLALVVAGFAVAHKVHASDYTTNDNRTVSELYRSQELSFDIFASGSVGQQTINNITGDTLRHDGRFGAGLGLNYFFHRNVGIGGDVYSDDFKQHFVDSTSGNLIFRFPIGESGLAPYLFGGGGHQFDRVQQDFGQAGAGLEFRVAHNLGFFVDARYVIPDKTDNYGVARAGLRWSF